MVHDQLTDPCHYTRELWWNIHLVDYASVEYRRHRHAVNVKGLVVTHTVLVHQLEVLYGYTIVSEEIVPPIQEGSIDTSSCHVLSDLIDTHLVVNRQP